MTIPLSVTHKRVLRYLGELDEFKTCEEMRKDLKIPYKVLRHSINHLYKKGYLKRIPRFSDMRTYTYIVVEATA